MAITIHIQATVEDENSQLASLDRYYYVESLEKLSDCVAHFGKASTCMLEGAAIGMDVDHTKDSIG